MGWALRHVITACAVVSALCCLTVVAFWLRSHWVADVWTHTVHASKANVGSSHTLRVHSARGVVALNRTVTTSVRRLPATVRDRQGRTQVVTSWPDFSRSERTWMTVDASAVIFTMKKWWQRFGFDAFALRSFRAGGGTTTHGVLVPHWLVALATALPPGFILWRRRRYGRRQRLLNGLCLGCGYDLRESPDRCPECGTPRPSTAGHASAPKVGR